LKTSHLNNRDYWSRSRSGLWYISP